LEFTRLNETHKKELKSIVAPDRFSTGESNLDLHSRDQSHHEAFRPEAVIWPISGDEVSKILKYTNKHLIPVTGWGAGTSLEGNPIPVRAGLILDFSQMNHILDIREEDFQVDVEPGIDYRALNEALRHKGLFFPPDPGASATIGGMIANNASGTRTVRYGSTKDHVLRLSVVLANGEMIEMGTRASKTSSGYDLIHLFVGSEGTLGIVVQATLHLTGLPEESSAAVVTFPSVEAAGKAVFGIIRSGLDPALLELLAPECVDLMNQEKGLGLDVSPSLFVEFHGPTKTQLADVMEIAREICQDEDCSEFRPAIGREEKDQLLRARHELGEMFMRKHPNRRTVAMDVAVPITAYPELIAMAREETKNTGVPAYVFGHAGDGNIHVALMRNAEDQRESEIIERVSHRIVEKALSMDGTATGEHGVGIGKRQYMEIEHGRSLEWMKKIKAVLDPNGILNPGKVFP
jgi:D-lactate dehydrogenase (cytochrome)